MARTLGIRDFLKATADLPVLDVRSEGEFAEGHIPGAISLPLFSNDERAAVGTLYKQEGRQQAILRGLEFAGAKLSVLASEGLRLASGNRIAVHCWRGGMRSASVAWLLEQVGLEVFVLIDGYKAYRRLCIELFGTPPHLHVLGGKTGSRKTAILHELKAAGVATVDLEALADHRGSAFGYTESGKQPTQEQFENDLGMALWRNGSHGPVVVEDESRLLGRLHIPDPLWRQMQRATVLVVESPVEKRIEYLLSVYDAPAEKILLSLMAIRKRLGPERHALAVTALAEGRRDEVCRIVIDYYDRAYTYGLSLRDATTLSYLPVETAVEEILKRFSCKFD